MRRGLWQDWVNLVLGAWLLIAPFVGVGAMSEPAVWNSYLCGALVMVFAWAAIARPHRWEEWLNLAIGAWLVISPFVLNYADYAGAMWNHVVVGILIAADAAWAMRSPVHHRSHA